MPDPTARQIKALARRILKESGVRGLIVVIARGEVTFVTDAVKPKKGKVAVVPATVTGLQQQLLAALTPEPQKAEAIALACKRKCDSYLRESLARLEELGLARRSRGGYRTP